MNDEQDPLHFETDAQPEPPQIGESLRAAREARGESVADVAAALKFSSRQVLAMEAERLHELPGPAFVKGFYRNYGRYLGVDIEPMIAARWAEPSARSVELSPITNARGTLPGSRRGGGVGRVFAALVSVLVLVLALGWYFDGFRLEDRPADEAGGELAGSSGNEPAPAPDVEIVDDDPLPAQSAGASDEAAASTAPGTSSMQFPAIIEAPPAAARSRPEATSGDAPGAHSEVAESTAVRAESSQPDPPLPEAAAPVEQAPAQSEPVESAEGGAASESASPAEPQPDVTSSGPRVVGSGSSRLVFSLSADAWLQVKDAQDRTLYVGTSRSGTTRVVQGDPPFWVTVGNADAVSLEFDGEPVELAPHMHTAGVARLVLE